ncbi:hypothetical protein V6N13_028925 [Hibiscus sabdariffa]
MISAPKRAIDAINAHQQAQHATSTHGAAREAICSMLGLHHAIRPGPPLGALEASTTDMARGSPSQCLSFLFLSISLVILYLGNVGFVSLDKDLL